MPKPTQQLLERVETIEALLRGFADVSAGRAKRAPVAFNRLRRSMAFRVELTKSRKRHQCPIESANRQSLRQLLESDRVHPRA